MQKEILACIKIENLKFLHSGQIARYIFPMEREEAHKKNICHLITRLFVVALKPNNDFLYLVQKRGKDKRTFPHYFTDSSSGHVTYKKDLTIKDIKQEAKRELNEEFGIPFTSIIKLRFYDLLAEKNQRTTEISYVFLAIVPYDIKLNPNPEELDINDSRFYTKLELKDIIEHENSIDYSKKIWQKLINSDLKELFNLDQAKDNKKSQKKKIALFIGRFQPLHYGHIYVMKKILKDYNILKIGIGSAQLSHVKANPFTSEERIKFISSALSVRNIPSNRYYIFEISDIFNANKWVDHVKSIVGDFDIVFSNSDWIRELFNKSGYKVGNKIEIFKKKYNGSNIRKFIRKNNKNWKTLVSKEVVSLIRSFNGLERIRTLENTKD
ncbi:MAG: nicotinamide-nucleotide adenylyltransferase [Candidatus Thorarchaeota archaeon]